MKKHLSLVHMNALQMREKPLVIDLRQLREQTVQFRRLHTFRLSFFVCNYLLWLLGRGLQLKANSSIREKSVFLAFTHFA